jgi:hypothetical protein
LLDLDILELYSKNSKPIFFLFFLLYSFSYILEFLKEYLIIQIIKILSRIKKILEEKANIILSLEKTDSIYDFNLLISLLLVEATNI